VAHILTPV